MGEIGKLEIFSKKGEIWKHIYMLLHICCYTYICEGWYTYICVENIYVGNENIYVYLLWIEKKLESLAKVGKLGNGENNAKSAKYFEMLNGKQRFEIGVCQYFQDPVWQIRSKLKSIPPCQTPWLTDVGGPSGTDVTYL